MKGLRQKILLASLLLFAFFVRVYGLNWDQNQHFHPDERFLTMVAVAQKFPTSLEQYFDPSQSELNPANVGFPFYVYGTFPVTFVKYVSTIFGKGDYFNLTLMGRGVSAMFDVGIVFFVYALAALLQKRFNWSRWIKYAAAFLYSVMVLPIQQAHFFTVDTFVTFFMFGALYFAVKYYYSSPLQAPKWYPPYLPVISAPMLLCGVFMGLAVASKINAIYIVPLIGVLLLLPFLSIFVTSEVTKKDKQREFLARILSLLMMTVLAYLVLRFADPYIFATNNFFDLRPNPTLLNNIHQLQGYNNPEAWFPPGVQWITKTKIVFPLQNIFFFGMGPVLFIVSVLGLISLIRRIGPIGSKNGLEIKLIFLWAGAFFLYQSIQFSIPMRYFYILYPLLAIGAGYFLVELSSSKGLVVSSQGKLKLIRRAGYFLLPTALILILMWPLMFMAIYTRPHSRVIASKWMNQNIPVSSVLAQEHWDDALPVSFEKYNSQQYQIIQMPVFGPDDEAKWKQIHDDLQRAHYIVFTSNRGYGSIGSVPSRYPKMSKFYTDLFAGKLEFRKIQEFTSYPGISIGSIAIEIPDQWSEEAFTVYDHPKITIFKKI